MTDSNSIGMGCGQRYLHPHPPRS